MLGKVKTLDARLLTRRCVACGYDGALLQGGQARRCARCGCDLQKRPARSYAEMEGLLGHSLALDDQEPAADEPSPESLIQRWLAFLFMAVICLIAIIMLATAALAEI